MGLEGIDEAGDRTSERKAAGEYRADFALGTLAGIGQEDGGSLLFIGKSYPFFV